MNSKEMYAPHPRIGSNCHPQSMQVHISSVPENLMEEWEISVHDSTLKKGRILPDSIQYNVNFNIAPFQDSIVFHAKGSNLMGMEINDSLIIPIKRHIVDLSETIDTNSIPVIWHMKEMKAILPHFIRYATCFKKYPAEISEKDKAHPYQNHIRLFVSEYNAIAVDNVIKMLSNEPLLKEFTFSKIELHQNHKLARMIRSTISRVQSEEYGNVIPVLIE
jgi:hypothetical protein